MTIGQHNIDPAAATRGADSRDPSRFQRLGPTVPKPHVATSIASAAVLLLLVVGVPVALAAMGGVPHVPTSLPTRAQLVATIGAEQLLAVLVWIVWVAWLQFTICVVVELRSALSGVGLPTRVPLAAPSQRFARTLVASVLLLVMAAGQANAVTQSAMATHEQASPTSVSRVLDAEGHGAAATAAPAAASAPAAAAATAGAETARGAASYHLGDLELSPEEGAQLVGKKVYVVQPPEGRHHDNLWDIAERGLGDGRRYQEIFELNRGREQPDGHEVSLARLIYPNWLLIMPDDAVGVDRVTAVFAPTPAPAPVTFATADAVGGAEHAVAASDGVSTDALAQASDGASEQAEQGISEQSLLGAGLLAAGLLVAIDQLRRRRRTNEPSEEAVDVEIALRVGADPQRATRLDHALRGLAATLRADGRDLPGAYAAVVGDTELTLHLAPADSGAPAPWRAQDDGRRWVLDAAEVTATSRTAPAPFPGLVSVGRDDAGCDVLIDLEAAQGPVAIVGDPTVALEVATALAVELATNCWSDQLRVTGVDLPAELTVLDGARYRSVGSVADVLPELRGSRADSLGAGVLTGRLRGSGASAWMPEYVVLGSSPAAELAEQLAELAATDQRSPLGIVCVGELPGARWRLEVDAAGSLAVRLLDVQVRANRLGRAEVAALAELLTAAPEVPDALIAAAAAIEHEAALDRPVLGAPDQPVGPADLAAAPVRVFVFGTPRVEAPAPIAPERLALATELVVHLALHPGGVHPTVLASALWPRGVTAAVREATIARTRDWLGLDAHGAQHLRQLADGRLTLGPGVVLDWDVVRTLLARSRTATSPAQERSELTGALRLARDAVLAGRPAGRYAWLARVRLERAARDVLVDAAHRLAILSWGDDDPAGARAAAEAGLRLAPTEELLWRDLLRAAAATGGTTAVYEVAASLEEALHDAGIVDVTAPTGALLEELAPASGPEPTHGVARLA